MSCWHSYHPDEVPSRGKQKIMAKKSFKLLSCHFLCTSPYYLYCNKHLCKWFSTVKAESCVKDYDEDETALIKSGTLPHARTWKAQKVFHLGKLFLLKNLCRLPEGDGHHMLEGTTKVFKSKMAAKVCQFNSLPPWIIDVTLCSVPISAPFLQGSLYLFPPQLTALLLIGIHLCGSYQG